MQLIHLENQAYSADVSPLGAELHKVVDKAHDRQILWTGDPAVWKRHSPVLFPVIGRLKNLEYTYEGKTYHLGQHGFCQDTLFALESASSSSVTFSLTASSATRSVYPFEFTFYVSYVLLDNCVEVSYLVQNNSTDSPMYFSVGGHPGFLYSGDLSQQQIIFSRPETLDRIPLNMKTGQFSRRLIKDYVRNGEPIQITEHLYDEDALVFHNFTSESVKVVNKDTGRGVKVNLGKFPYVGFWSRPGAAYTCVEPWFGLADYEDSTGDLTRKDGIQKLNARETFRACFSFEGI